MSEYTVTNAERDCLAAPASWIMETENAGELVARYRNGSLTITDRDSREELFRVSIGDAYDGHITLYEVRDELQSSPIEFNVSLPQEYYGLPIDVCTLEVFGEWLSSISCDNCDWMLSSDSVPTFEYETVLPPHCPECGGEFTVETDTPEHLQDLQSEEEIPDDMLETMDGLIQE